MTSLNPENFSTWWITFGKVLVWAGSELSQRLPWKVHRCFLRQIQNTPHRLQTVWRWNFTRTYWQVTSWMSSDGPEPWCGNNPTEREITDRCVWNSSHMSHIPKMSFRNTYVQAPIGAWRKSTKLKFHSNTVHVTMKSVRLILKGSQVCAVTAAASCKGFVSSTGSTKESIPFVFPAEFTHFLPFVIFLSWCFFSGKSSCPGNPAIKQSGKASTLCCQQGVELSLYSGATSNQST